ncbi:MAG: thioredoxin family protein [Chloroflexi bacterium]|nr:thioredoxin family protein [Chloroflexota bacterium]
MALISSKDQQMLRDLFSERLQGDVTITYFTQRESILTVPGQECQFCKDTRELLEEVTGLSNKLYLRVQDFVRDAQAAEQLGVERIPAFVLAGQARGQVRYFGIPSGYEFSSLIEDLLDVSIGRTRLSDQTREALGGLEQDLHIQVFVTPT